MTKIEFNRQAPWEEFSFKSPALRTITGNQPNSDSNIKILDSNFDIKEWKALHEEVKNINQAPGHSFQVDCLKNILAQNREKGIEVLNEIYPVYEKVFADPTQRTSKEEILQVLSDPNEARDIMIFRDGEKFVGAVHFTAFETVFSRVAALEYIYIDPELRRKGAGNEVLNFFEDVLKKRNFDCIQAEVNDPNVMTERELQIESSCGMDTKRKLGFWDKHGYQTIDGPYSQPPLGGQKSSCDYLLFAVKLLHGTYSSGILADHYLDLNAGFFKTFTTPEYAGQILKQTEEAIQQAFVLNLIPITEKRSFGRLKGIAE